MKIRTGYLLFTIGLAGLVACSDSGDDDEGGNDEGGNDDESGGDDDSGGPEPDAGAGADGASAECLGAPRQMPGEPWVHVPESAGIAYSNEPPASGTHYDVWATWAVHGELARGYWVHNLEHGGIVLLHRPDAPGEVVEALNQSYEAIPNDPECGHRRAILASDIELTTPVAVIAADWVMDGDCVDQDRILAFVDEHRGQGREDLCDEGTIL